MQTAAWRLPGADKGLTGEAHLMSPFIAIAVVGLFHAAVMLPLAAVVFRPTIIPVVAAGYAALVVLIAAYQAGLFQQPATADLTVPDIAASATSAQCAEVLSLLDGAGAIVDRRHPPRLVVSGSLWSQLPEEARQIVTECVQRSWGGSAPQAQIVNAP